MKEKFKFITNFFNILEEMSIDYWLEGGTALAAYRDGEIFPWEHDFDIGILKDDIDGKLEIFLSKLHKYNLTVKIQKDYPFLDNIIQIYSNDNFSNPNQIDIYLYTQKENKIYMRWLNSPIGFGSKLINSIMYLSTKKNSSLHSKKSLFNKNLLNLRKLIFYFILLINFNFYKSRYHCFPKNFFQRKKKVLFCGLYLDLPYKIEEFLEFRYGKNWKKPDENFNQSGKWKSSKARPIMKQNFLEFPKFNYNLYMYNEKNN